jgi:parallel beta-helix repeat protein
MGRTRFGARAGVLAAAVAGVMAVSAPAAMAISCGDVITTNTKLTKNLECPPGTDGLIIGASGITLDLNKKTITGGRDQTFFGPAGVRIPAAFTGVTVKRGTIEEFAAGLSIEGDGNIASDLTIRQSYFGFQVEGDVNQLKNITAVLNISGDVFFGTGNIVSKSKLTTGAAGMQFVGDSNTLKDSTISTTGVGIFINENNSVFTGNRVKNSLSDGIFVDAGATGVLISKNTVEGSGDDGIDVNSPGVTLSKNKVFDNGDYGIEAVEGVIDGGGNKAKGNGEDDQCLNIDC